MHEGLVGEGRVPEEPRQQRGRLPRDKEYFQSFYNINKYLKNTKTKNMKKGIYKYHDYRKIL